MANRLFDQFRYSVEKKVVDLFLHFSVGAVGAPTIVRGKGIESVTRTAAGQYQIVLEDKYSALLFMDAMLMAAASEDLDFQIEAYDLDLKTIDILTRAAAIDTDPSNGSEVFLKLSLSNTSI